MEQLLFAGRLVQILAAASEFASKKLGERSVHEQVFRSAWSNCAPQTLSITRLLSEPSHDEPFIIPVKGKDFVTVPYTFHMNDISSFPFEGYNPMAYEQALNDEFDQLYEEGATRRRMMLIGFHDRINGHANRIRMLDRFFTYAKSHEDVWFARKDEIAKWVLEHREDTPILKQRPTSTEGLPGGKIA